MFNVECSKPYPGLIRKIKPHLKGNTMNAYTIKESFINPNAKNQGTTTVFINPDKAHGRIEGATYLDPMTLEDHPSQADIRYASGQPDAELLAQIIGADRLSNIPRTNDQTQDFTLGYNAADPGGLVTVCEWKRGKKTIRTIVRGHRRCQAYRDWFNASPDLIQAVYPDGLPCKVIEGKPTDPDVERYFFDHGKDRRRDLYAVERFDMFLLYAERTLADPQNPDIDPESFPTEKTEQLAKVREIADRTKASGKVRLGMIYQRIEAETALRKNHLDKVVYFAFLPDGVYDYAREHAKKGKEKPTVSQLKKLYDAALETTKTRVHAATRAEAEAKAKKAGSSPDACKEAGEKAVKAIGSKVGRPTPDDAATDTFALTLKEVKNPATNDKTSRPASPKQIKDLAEAVADFAKDSGKDAAALVGLLETLAANEYDKDTASATVQTLIAALPA